MGQEKLYMGQESLIGWDRRRWLDGTREVDITSKQDDFFWQQMSHFDLCEDDWYQNCKAIVTKNLRWYYHLTMDEKWPNYRGMAARYWMSHQYHLAFYFWCKIKKAEEDASEAVKVAMLIRGADKRRCSKLKDKLANNYLLGTDKYPVTFYKVLRILINYQTARSSLPYKASPNNTGVTFLQWDGKGGQGRCRGRGGCKIFRELHWRRYL